MRAALTTTERDRLAQHVQTIREGERYFLAVGRALSDIQREKLYREKYDTFEAFVEQELGYSRRYGYFLKQGAEIADDVNNCAQIEVKITRESQARPLSSVPQKARVVVWGQAVKRAGGKAPTASHVMAAAKAYQSARARGPAKPVAAPKPFMSEIEQLQFIEKNLPPIFSSLTVDINKPLFKDIKDRGGFSALESMTLRLVARILTGLESNEHVALCPPFVDDVRAFALEENVPDYAEDFLDHYEGNNWTAGSNLVTNWRRKYRQWCRRQGDFQTNGKSTSVHAARARHSVADSARQTEEAIANYEARQRPGLAS